MNTTITIAVLFFATAIFAQSFPEPATLIGQPVSAPSVQKFMENNSLKSTVAGRYSATTSGIELKTQRDTVVSVDFYRTNAAFGRYTGPLYKGIAFGMANPEIYIHLGKPSMSYTNSGYSEYKINGAVVTVWFENKVLNQVSLSTP